MELETDAPQGEPQDTPAPVESTSEATTEQTASTETDVQPDTGEEGSEERVKREPWFTKRINEVTRQKYEAQRRAEALEAQLASIQQQPQAQPQTDKGPPTLDDYHWDVDAHARATAEYYRNEAKATVRAELAAERAEQQQQARMTEIQGKLAEGANKHADFLDVATMIPTNEPVMDFLASVPGAVDVLYEVGKNPVEADRIFSLSPYQQAVELGRLAALRETPRPASRTIAPPPPQTVAGMAAGLAKTPAEMSMSEYIQWREANP